MYIYNGCDINLVSSSHCGILAYQSTVVSAMDFFELLNGGSHSGCKEKASLRHIAVMTILQQCLVSVKTKLCKTFYPMGDLIEYHI